MQLSENTRGKWRVVRVKPTRRVVREDMTEGEANDMRAVLSNLFADFEYVAERQPSGGKSGGWAESMTSLPVLVQRSEPDPGPPVAERVMDLVDPGTAVAGGERVDEGGDDGEQSGGVGDHEELRA